MEISFGTWSICSPHPEKHFGLSKKIVKRLRDLKSREMYAQKILSEFFDISNTFKWNLKTKSIALECQNATPEQKGFWN